MYTFRSSRNRFYDKLHRGTVSILMGLTIVGFGFVSYEFYDWWYVYRPQVKDAHNKKLLVEGKSDFEEYDSNEKATPLGQASSN